MNASSLNKQIRDLGAGFEKVRVDQENIRADQHRIGSLVDRMFMFDQGHVIVGMVADRVSGCVQDLVARAAPAAARAAALAEARALAASAVADPNRRRTMIKAARAAEWRSAARDLPWRLFDAAWARAVPEGGVVALLGPGCEAAIDFARRYHGKSSFVPSRTGVPRERQVSTTQLLETAVRWETALVSLLRLYDAWAPRDPAAAAIEPVPPAGTAPPTIAAACEWLLERDTRPEGVPGPLPRTIWR